LREIHIPLSLNESAFNLLQNGDMILYKPADSDPVRVIYLGRSPVETIAQIVDDDIDYMHTQYSVVCVVHQPFGGHETGKVLDLMDDTLYLDQILIPSYDDL